MGNSGTKEKIKYEMKAKEKKLITDRVLETFIKCYPHIDFQLNDIDVEMLLTNWNYIDSSRDYNNITFVITHRMNRGTKPMNEELLNLTTIHGGYRFLYTMFTKYVNNVNVGKDLFRYFHRVITKTPRIVYELLMAQKFRKNSIPNILSKDIIKIIIKRYINDYLDLAVDLTIKKYNLFDDEFYNSKHKPEHRKIQIDKSDYHETYQHAKHYQYENIHNFLHDSVIFYMIRNNQDI